MAGRGEETESAELLERAVGYALCSVRQVTPALLSRPTPCRGWDLAALLGHANDSLAALHEGTAAGRVGLLPAAEACGDPVAAFRLHASRLLGACAARAPGRGRRGQAVVTVDGWPLESAALAAAGALEVAVHGWDIGRATGLPRPIPPALAAALLRAARGLVPEPAERYPLFALPVAVPARADPGDRLVAFLGRDPR
ncbi:TIGR03086 family protein [Streptomyces sp. RKND-216]|uniref:TIGR03086 family metal-binding protein n=1 Tax=Streptomyces sp. RKND-216 TaxID=2562581 RepID=UPI00109DED63|nr:TIGR03086 family metal-binding protein [Streptomyces sp. RKND-216]THA26075.1 TIGR03086 family protein [Streptomyces sp. RKND-216]